MPECAKIRENLTAYLDNQLDSYIRGLIEIHLKDCPSCRKELDALRKTWILLDNYPDLPVAESYKERFYSRLKHAGQHIGWLYPAVAAAAVIVIAITLFFTFANPPDGLKQPETGVEPSANTVFIADVTEEDVNVINNMEILEELKEFDDAELIELVEFLDINQNDELYQDLMELDYELF